VKVEAGADGIVISAAVELICRRGRAEIVDGKTGRVATSSRTDPKTALIQTIVQAEYWRAELLKEPSATLNEVLKPRDVQSAYIRRLLNAAYLAPAIKRAIFQGTQPSELQVQDLLKPRSLDWNIQMVEMGFFRSRGQRLPLIAAEKPLGIPKSYKVDIGPASNRETSGRNCKIGP
jgi:hypothetical protein